MIKQVIKKKILELITKEYPQIPSLEFMVDEPASEIEADLCSNAAFPLGKLLNCPPFEVAKLLSEKILDSSIFKKIEVSKNGFLNFILEDKALRKIIWEISQGNGDYLGETHKKSSERILLEYVSANPTGPLHIGHGRGAALGDSLSRVLRAAGYNVATEFYINDAGSQVQNLALSVLLRCREINGEEVEWSENLYKGEYVNDLAQEFLEKGGKVIVEQAGPYALNEILGWLRRDLEGFNVTFDKWFSEKSLYDSDKVQKAIDLLKQNGLMYEKDGALWFRSTDFGDDKDRVVIRENGEPTYFASDIASHHDKFERGFDTLINIWGADHHGTCRGDRLCRR